MTEGGEKRPINGIIFNKWALLGLAILIIIALAWSEYTWRPSNTDNLNISDSNVVCQKKKDREWYRITLTTPSNIELFLGGSYRINECEELKSEIITKVSNAQVLKPNGLVLKIESTDNTLYQAEKPVFATI